MKVKADRRPAHGEALDQDAARRIPRRSSFASAASKVSTMAPSSPVAASSRNLAASSVSRNSGSPGLKKVRGCGSKVSAAAGREAPAPAPAPPRSRPYGRDGRRRNCRWRRPRHATRHARISATSRTMRKLFVGIGATMVKNTLFGSPVRCRRRRRKVKHAQPAAAAGRASPGAINPLVQPPDVAWPVWEGTVAAVNRLGRDLRMPAFSPRDNRAECAGRARELESDGARSENARARGRRLQHHGPHHPQSVASARLRRHRRRPRRRRGAREDEAPSATASSSRIGTWSR